MILKSKKRFNKLSTFGIMSTFDRNKLEELIYYLISEKYLEQSAGSFPVLKLTKKAFDVLKDKKAIFRKINETISFDYFEDEIFEKLNNLRKDIAQKENVAPYIIFSDLTLLEMAEKNLKLVGICLKFVVLEIKNLKIMVPYF